MRLIIILISALLISFPSNAKQLSFVVGFSKPPYVLQQDSSGFELELVRAIFAKMDHQVEYLYVPFGRSPSMLAKDYVDGILTVNNKLVPNSRALSKPYITYQNVVVTWNMAAFNIENIASLSKLSVVAFQNATKILGPDYAKAVKDSPMYMEVPDQSRQIKLLHQSKTQALVMDINIFKYLLKEHTNESVERFKFHYVFPPSPYSIALKDPELIENFEATYQQYILSDDYQGLRSKYNIELN